MSERKKYSIAAWLFLLGAAVLYAGMAFSDNIWADEAYTFAMIRHSFPEIWKITAADVHPPLYYFLTKIISMPFGYSQYAVRLFSGVCYLLVLGIGCHQITRFFGGKTAALFGVLFVLYPFSLGYAVEARMYALGALLVTLNALFAYRIWEGGRIWDWVGFTLAGVCAAYTHYFALVSAGVVYGLLFLCCLIRNRKLLKPWLIASVATAVLYIPWLKCFVEQLAFKVSNDYWIEPITFRTFFDYALTLLHSNGYSVFPAVFGLILAGLTVWMLLRRKTVGLLALLVPALTVGLGVGVSMLVRPIFVIRYLAPCGPLMIFFLAYGIGQLPKKTLQAALSGILIVSFLGNLAFALTDLLPNPDKISKDFPSADACIVFTENSLHISQVVCHYRPEMPVYTYETLGAASPYFNDHSLDEFSAESFRSVLFITDTGSGPSGSYAAGFTLTRLGSFCDGLGQYVDVWMMEK